MPISLDAPIRLRPCEPRPIVQNGQRALWLRDPLELSEGRIVVPQQLVPLISLIDGHRDARALRAALAVRYGLALPESTMVSILNALDQACLLENERSQNAMRDARQAFRSAPFRSSPLAGESYPAEPAELYALLEGYLEDLDPSEAPPGICRGLVSPHIDYARGGDTYAHVWRHAREAARAAEVAIILGTDHYGSLGSLTLTRQHYATPYGVLPTDQDAVDTVVATIGEDEAFAEELHHRSEHSIELSAVWLHHMRSGEPCDLVPVLCGSIDRPSKEGLDLESGDRMRQAADSLREAVAGRQVLVIASADLAHVGPAFGGSPHYDLEKAVVKSADQEMLAALRAGDPDAFLAHIRRDDNARHVCGVAPIYLGLRILGPTRGDLLAYDQCLADEERTSWVSVCALTFS